MGGIDPVLMTTLSRPSICSPKSGVMAFGELQTCLKLNNSELEAALGYFIHNKFDNFKSDDHNYNQLL